MSMCWVFAVAFGVNAFGGDKLGRETASMTVANEMSDVSPLTMPLDVFVSNPNETEKIV